VLWSRALRSSLFRMKEVLSAKQCEMPELEPIATATDVPRSVSQSDGSRPKSLSERGIFAAVHIQCTRGVPRSSTVYR